MKALHRRCAGLDGHQKEIVACRRIASGGRARSELGRFATTTQGDLALSAVAGQGDARGDGGDRGRVFLPAIEGRAGDADRLRPSSAVRPFAIARRQRATTACLLSASIFGVFRREKT
jgi:hypothetical protein